MPSVAVLTDLTPADRCARGCPLTLLAVRNQVMLSFLDHCHVPQSLTEPQYRCMVITAVHRTADLQKTSTDN